MASEDGGPRRPARRTAAAALGLFVATGGFNHWVLARAPVAPGEEHFLLAERLHDYGVLGLTGTPSVFRPPGFPAFAAGVLHVRDRVAPAMDGQRAVALAHGWLLAMAAAALFLHRAREGPLLAALAAGALVAVNPVSLALASTLSYPALHVASTLAASIALGRALASPRRPMASALGAGALWGLATLVRPLSLILPPFVLALAGWTGGRRRALRFAAVFTLGMAVVVLPWTARNYRVTGRIVPVNAQDGFALWGLTATRAPAGGALEWVFVWRSEGAPLFAQAVGRRYSIRSLHTHAIAANDAFRADALRRIREDPARFARNALVTSGLFAADSMASWLEERPLSQALAVFVLLLGAAGLVRGLAARRTDARVVAAVFLMFAAAHAGALLIPRYTYIRLPLVLLAVPMALPRRGVLLAGVALAAAVTAAVEITPAPDAGARSPDAPITRADAARRVIAAREGPAHAPPPCILPAFEDVPCTHPDAAWISEAAERGVAVGCGPAAYCPDQPVTRAEIAAFLLRAREGPGFRPPPCVTPVFDDVPCSDPHAAWVNEMEARNISEGCGHGRYCPRTLVTQRQMDVFLAAAFGSPGK